MSGKVRIFVFVKQFAPLVESGKKRTTIRIEEKPRAEVGDIMRAINGKRAELRRAEIIGVQPFELFRKKRHGPVFLKRNGVFGKVYQSDNSLERADMSTLAHQDGFASLSDFVDYFSDEEWGEPFHVVGWLYRW